MGSIKAINVFNAVSICFGIYFILCSMYFHCLCLERDTGSNPLDDIYYLLRRIASKFCIEMRPEQVSQECRPVIVIHESYLYLRYIGDSILLLSPSAVRQIYHVAFSLMFLSYLIALLDHDVYNRWASKIVHVIEMME